MRSTTNFIFYSLSATHHPTFRLVTDLGLHTNLASNGVPREDLPRIAEQAIGNLKDPRYKYDDLVKILESIYQN